MSVVSLGDAPAQSWVAQRPTLAERGSLVEDEGPDGRRVWLYAPPGVEDHARLPLVIALDGDMWSSHLSLATTLDNLIADAQIRPVRAVLVDAGDRQRRWTEMSAEGEGSRWLVDRLLPWVRQWVGVVDDPRQIVVMGQSLGGYTALRAVLEHPAQVGGALAQSASLWQQDLAEALADPGVAVGLGAARVWLEVGLQEWVLLEPTRRFAAALRRAGVEVREVEFNGGHDYACWRGGIADGLRWLLPPCVAS